MSMSSSGHRREAGEKGDKPRKTPSERGREPAPQQHPDQPADEQPAASAAEEGKISPEELEELRKKAAERDEIYDQLLRMAAEFDNRRKRLERDAENRVRYAVQDLLTDVLPVFDDLSRAVNAARSSPGGEAILEGIQMVEKHLYDALAKHGVRPIATVGEPFDPRVHEAVSVLPTDEHPESTVVEEVQRGWLLNDRVVRAAKVLVSIKPPRIEQEEQQDRENDREEG